LAVFNPTTKNDTFDAREFAFKLNARTTNRSSVFGETWSNQFIQGINDADALKGVMSLDNGKIDPLVKIFSVISELIKNRKVRGVDRDIFHATSGRWDMHKNLKSSLRTQFKELNEGLGLFVKETKKQGLFENVTIVITSDFGRTLTPNSGGGADHAWGGTYMMLGGGVKGGTVHGKYPSDITSSAPLNLGRGRILPTTSWDTILNAVNEHMGVEDEADLDYCLPNRHNSAGDAGSIFTSLYLKEDLFVSG